MNTHQTAVRRELFHFVQSEYNLQKRRELLLARRRHKEIPESTEALALVRTGDGVALREDLFQQRAFAALPGCNALANRAIQRAEVLLHFAEIREQAARRGSHLLKSILDLGRIEQR